MKKISVRNIPDDVYILLESLAEKNMRSVEAQIRYIIQKSVEPEDTPKTGKEIYLSNVSHRLTQALAKSNQITLRSYKLAPTHIAEEMDYPDLGTVANWFSGDALPSLLELKQLSEIFGCRSNWLIHGELPVYSSRSGADFRSYGRYAVKELMKPDEKGNEVKNIHLIREDDDTGSLLIIREFTGTRKVDNFWAGIHISEANGSGGETRLAELFVTLRALYKAYTSSGARLWVKSYQMQSGVYKELCEDKQQHPLTVLKDYRTKESVWWEDVWDEKQSEGRLSFWKNDSLTINKTRRHVNSNTHLAKEVEAIKASLPIEDN